MKYYYFTKKTCFSQNGAFFADKQTFDLFILALERRTLDRRIQSLKGLKDHVVLRMLASCNIC